MHFLFFYWSSFEKDWQGFSILIWTLSIGEDRSEKFSGREILGKCIHVAFFPLPSPLSSASFPPTHNILRWVCRSVLRNGAWRPSLSSLPPPPPSFTHSVEKLIIGKMSHPNWLLIFVCCKLCKFFVPDKPPFIYLSLTDPILSPSHPTAK